MAVSTNKIVPVLTGGAVIAAAFAFAYTTRRPLRAPLQIRDDEARFAPEPVGPDDGMVEVLSLASGPMPTAKSEAEAILGVGWPSLENTEPSSVGSDGLPSAALDLELNHSSNDSEYDRPTLLTGRAYASLGQGFAAVDPGEAFLDLDVEFEELEAPTDRDPATLATDFPRERLEAYDSVAPEDLGTEWLARATEAPSDDALTPTEFEAERLRLERMDTLEDLALEDAPTLPATISAARRRFAENDEPAPNSAITDSSRHA